MSKIEMNGRDVNHITRQNKGHGFIYFFIFLLC